MKKNIILPVLFALAALGLASCSSDSDMNPVTSPDEAVTPIRISASYGENGAPTRVAYTEDGSNITATWQTGDQLYVYYNGHVNTLSLTSGEGTTNATFDGTIQGTPSASSVLICYVRDANNPSAINVSDKGEMTYTSGAFTLQNGTMAGAAKCNVYYGTATYGTGENISCTFSVNTSILKFKVQAPDDVNANDEATLTYKTGDTELAKATFTVDASRINTVYMAVPAGQYTGEQTLNYKSGSTNMSKTLSATKASFTAGKTYSKSMFFGDYKDLSMMDNAGNNRVSRWTANCYMVHTGGNYKLPLVYGNAIKNGATNAAAYTGIENENTTLTFPNHAGNAITGPWIKDHSITVASAELLWQDAKRLITEVGISGDYLTLTVGMDATEQEGNALVAAKDGEGNIVWSWHIWVTKQTFGTLTSVNTGEHTYQVTPVNLGWVGEPESMGYNTYYQWGRKDAFIPGSGVSYDDSNHVVYNIRNEEVTGITYTQSTTATIADDIKNPTLFYYNESNDGPCNTTYYNMWDAQQTSKGYIVSGNDVNYYPISTATVKTVYDPCPAGFCVPTSKLYYYIESSRENFSWDGTNYGRKLTTVTPNLFFPATGYRESSTYGKSNIISNGSFALYCSASPHSDNNAWRLGFDKDYDTNTDVFRAKRSAGFLVRAVAEE